MIALRLVLDTNIVVSAALKPDGPQRTVVVLALTKPARWYVTESILDEYREVLARPELKIRKGKRAQLLRPIEKQTHLVRPARVLRVTPDPDDNMFIECADAPRRDHLRRPGVSERVACGAVPRSESFRADALRPAAQCAEGAGLRPRQGQSSRSSGSSGAASRD